MTKPSSNVNDDACSASNDNSSFVLVKCSLITSSKHLFAVVGVHQHFGVLSKICLLDVAINRQLTR